MDDPEAWQQPVRLQPQDHAAVLALHDRLHAAQPRASLFARETPAFFARCLGAEGQIYGISRHGALLAYGVLGLPPDADYNFGVWAGLPPDRHAEVAHLDGAGVDPQQRGKGFQRRLIACRLAAAQAAGRRLVYSTAAPDNRASLDNLLRSGFVIVALRRLFGGHERYILAHAPGSGQGTIV